MASLFHVKTSGSNRKPFVLVLEHRYIELFLRSTPAGRHSNNSFGNNQAGNQRGGFGGGFSGQSGFDNGMSDGYGDGK